MRRGNCYLVAAVLGAGLLTATPSSGKSAEEVQTVTVLVAKMDLAVNMIVTKPEELFRPVRYVKGDEPRGAITEFAQLKGVRLLRPLAEDQPVKQRDVLTAGVGMEYRIPAGMRAVSFKVADQGAAFDSARPGTRVDVVTTVERGGKTETKTALQNVQVLALGGLGGDRHTIVTVAVTSEQASALALAVEAGTIRLVPRSVKKD